MSGALEALQICDLAKQWPNLKAIHDLSMSDLTKLNADAQAELDKRAEAQAEIDAEVQAKAAAEKKAAVDAQAAVDKKAAKAAASVSE